MKTNSLSCLTRARVIIGTAAWVLCLTLAAPAGTIHYVNLYNPTPAAPYTNWAMASTNIQEAVDAAAPGALILVSNGVYQAGGRAVYGVSNRVAVTKPLSVQSVNGPAVTCIVGYHVPVTATGPGAVRCVYLTNGAVLEGFTLTNGANESGGGVWCESESAVVTNCVITGNSAYDGGGAYSGTLNNCTLTGNRASHYSGGAFRSTLNNCTLTGNIASYYGGGAYYGTLNNCTLTGNSATFYGGGAYYGTLNNCTLTGNSAYGCGGGAAGGTLNNCIVYYNIIYYYVPCQGGNYDECRLNYSCTTPLPFGSGNFTNAPLFLNTDGWTNLRLQSNSPCINAGHNPYAPGSTDLDGRPRLVGGTVDVGAYEFQGAGMSEYMGWLAQYRLRTDGSEDTADTDRDGLNNWQEWQADTNPTNALSCLRIESVVYGPPVAIRFKSSLNRFYTLSVCTNLAASTWLDVPGQSDLPGNGGTQTIYDPNAASPRFYRLRVRTP